MTTMTNEMTNEIDWEGVAERFHKVYDGKTREEQLIIRQMTDAWCETRLLGCIYAARCRQYGAQGGVLPRAAALECAAYAGHALEHWRILAGLLATTVEGVAEAMEREATRLRRIGWVTPVRACILDYRELCKLARVR